MAISCYGIVLIAAVLLSGPCIAVAQQTASASNPSYDQLKTGEKQAQAAQDAADAKDGKQEKQPAGAASTTPAPADPSVTSPADAAAAPTTDAAASDVPAKDPNVDPLKPVVYDKRGRVKVKKEKPPKLIPVNIVHGELTVDGLIAKAGLNFQVLDIKYFYIWVPGMGTVVASNHFFANSKLEVNALDGNTLTIKVDGHQLQLACDHALLEGKKPKPLSMYVLLDKNYDRGSNYPEFGYGDKNKAPYDWPGTLADTNPNTKAPPLPENLKQKQQIVKICPKNADGTQGPCHETEIPMVLGKKS